MAGGEGWGGGAAVRGKEERRGEEMLNTIAALEKTDGLPQRKDSTANPMPNPTSQKLRLQGAWNCKKNAAVRKRHFWRAP